ncbi:ER membrane protein DP1/Yop1 [Puccinia graminis f. sp. tritici]|uniref:Protein YOP1 n=1 Tax=Puccinia graminis f. sp. tritici TaxID=56615 RepID=A0A5B0NZG8_PUCGR|nr:ER membrane protein DP1/Yop1 [Puccinia graminis f. sp. tritici]
MSTGYTLTKLKRQLQVPKAYGALGLAGLFSIFVFFNLFGGFLTTTLGWGLPAYFSIQALQSPSSGDDVQWLTYWNIFGSFNIIKTFANTILYCLPFSLVNPVTLNSQATFC